MIDSIFSTKRHLVKLRKEVIKKFVALGHSKAEAERLMVLHFFRQTVRLLVNKKHIPADRLVRAVQEALVEEVMDS